MFEYGNSNNDNRLMSLHFIGKKITILFYGYTRDENKVVKLLESYVRC